MIVSLVIRPNIFVGSCSMDESMITGESNPIFKVNTQCLIRIFKKNRGSPLLFINTNNTYGADTCTKRRLRF